MMRIGILLATFTCICLMITMAPQSPGVSVSAAAHAAEKTPGCERAATRVPLYARMAHQCGRAAGLARLLPSTSAPAQSSCASPAPSHNPVSAGPSGVHTLLWIGGLYPDVAMGQLDKFQQYHINGFLYDHIYQGTHDDFLNGGVGRLSAHDCAAYSAATDELVRNATSRGITDIFLRILAQVLVRSNPPSLAYSLDVCNAAQVAKVRQTMLNEARFVRAKGLHGIWMDVEPYNNANLWYAEKQPGTFCYGKTYNSAALAYYRLGKVVGRALLHADPHIEILISPGIGVSYYRTGYYAHFPDFYAGLLAVASKTRGARGIANATEEAYGWTNTSWFAPIVKYEMGTGTWSNHTSGLQQILQKYDRIFNTKTWAWHIRHDSIALGTSPLSTRGDWNYPADDFPSIVIAQRTASRAFTWIYDQGGQWLKSSYSCTVQGKTIASALPCPGILLHDTLPPLPTPGTG